MLISRTVKHSSKLKLLSWNVHFPHFAQDSAYVVDTLKSLGRLDVICIQEYVQGANDHTEQWLKSQGYGLNFLSFSNDGSRHMGVMTAVYKGLPSKTKSVILREDGPIPSRPFDNVRGMLATNIDDKVTIYNTHLTFPRPYTRDMRKREFAELKDFLGDLPTEQNWFLCGDFNFLPIDSRRRHLKNNYQNFSGGVISKTWRHHRPFTPIRANLDYFFWSGDKINVAGRLIDFNHSDHRPMLAEISLG